MKKLLTAVLAATLAVSSVFAAAEQTVKKETWSPFQLVFLPGFPSSSNTANVYGLKLGIPATGGDASLRGVEASFLYSATSYNTKGKYVRGIQASWFGPSMAETLYGVQATQAYAYAEKMVGFQAGAVAFLGSPSIGCQAGGGAVAMSDFKGFQVGAATVTTGDFKGFQFGAANIATKKMTGCQCGAVGVAETATGCQCTLVNIITSVSKAFQCGIVNYSSSKGVQLGAVNIIADSWLPVMVIFNYHN